MKEQHQLVTMTVGFEFKSLTEQAVAHEHTTEFKRCIQSMLERDFGTQKLAEMGTPRVAFQGIAHEDITEADILRKANSDLCECSSRMNAAVIRSRCCLYSPPNRWRKCSWASVHKDGRPLMAHDAVVEYEGQLVKRGEDPLDEAVRDELKALPLQLQLTWDVEL